jgi:hypothetical protein
MDTVILTSDDEEDEDTDLKTRWEKCCRDCAEHMYSTSAQRVDIASIGDDGKICPPSLFLIACENYRKKCFIELWVHAHKWLAEGVGNFGDPRLYDEAEEILLMNAEDIKKKLAGIKV